MRQFFLSLLLGLLMFPFLANAQNAGENAPIRYDTPSKLPVPRFVSMRFDKVNGRAGPSEDYPIRFVYKTHGLPVKVVAETLDWRKVQDPDGAVVWVHKRNLDAKRTLIIRPKQAGSTNVILYQKMDLSSKVLAKIASGSICEIIGSENGWRKVRIGRYKGYIVAVDAWGS